MPDLASIIRRYPQLTGTNASGVRRAFVPLSEINGTVTSAYAVPFLTPTSCLVARRRDGNCTVPGGTIEEGETWESALRRELLEETGASIGCFGPVGAYRLTGEQRTTFRIFCWAEVTKLAESDEPETAEHSIAELIVTDPRKAPALFEGDFAHLGSVYSLISDIYLSSDR